MSRPQGLQHMAFRVFYMNIDWRTPTSPQ